MPIFLRGRNRRVLARRHRRDAIDATPKRRRRGARAVVRLLERKLLMINLGVALRGAGDLLALGIEVGHGLGYVDLFVGVPNFSAVSAPRDRVADAHDLDGRIELEVGGQPDAAAAARGPRRIVGLFGAFAHRFAVAIRSVMRKLVRFTVRLFVEAQSGPGFLHFSEAVEASIALVVGPRQRANVGFGRREAGAGEREDDSQARHLRGLRGRGGGRRFSKPPRPYSSGVGTSA